jgi:fibronectin type 3 domain-containing protein
LIPSGAVLVEDEIMPEPVKFLGGRVKADYNVRMSWDFEANPEEGQRRWLKRLRGEAR